MEVTGRLVSSLREAIELWRAAHPEFSPLTPASPAVGSSADDDIAAAHVGPDVAPASCVQAHGGAVPVILPTRAQEGEWARGAKRLNLDPDDYRRHALKGERWCTGHQSWHPHGTLFHINASVCTSGWDTYRQALRERAS